MFASRWESISKRCWWLGGPEVWFDTQGTQWKVSHMNTEHFPQVASDKCLLSLHTHTHVLQLAQSNLYLNMLHKFLTWLWSVSSAADRLQITKKEICLLGAATTVAAGEASWWNDLNIWICIKSRTTLAHTQSAIWDGLGARIRLVCHAECVIVSSIIICNQTQRYRIVASASRHTMRRRRTWNR